MNMNNTGSGTMCLWSGLVLQQPSKMTVAILRLGKHDQETANSIAGCVASLLVPMHHFEAAQCSCSSVPVGVVLWRQHAGAAWCAVYYTGGEG